MPFSIPQKHNAMRKLTV